MATMPASRIDLDHLAEGFRHIPAASGLSYAQAGAVCLDNQGHGSGVQLTVRGSFTQTYLLHWPWEITDAMRRFWNDLEVATEHGAYAIAILIMKMLTGFTVVERAKKGTGIDWWLGTEDNLFQAKARLEVSGILSGTPKQVSHRVSLKTSQTAQSDAFNLTAYVAVVEFGAPMSRVVQR